MEGERGRKVAHFDAARIERRVRPCGRGKVDLSMRGEDYKFTVNYYPLTERGGTHTIVRVSSFREIPTLCFISDLVF